MKKIGIFGMGGIGGYVGAHLAQARDKRPAGAIQLSFIARGNHLDTIRSKGLSFQSPDGKKITVRPDAAVGSAAELPVQDLIVLSVKGYGLAEACEAIRPIVGDKTAVMPLLNGIDILERCRRILKNGIILPSCIYIASSIKEPGLVVHGGGKGDITSGPEPGKEGFDPGALRSIMADAGIPFEWQENPFPALWNKYLFIASFALVTGRSGKTIGGVVADPLLSGQVKGILREIAALARAKGVELPAAIVDTSFDKGKAFPFETKTSFQRDVETPGKPNEGDLFGGTIIRMGKELGVPTPVTEEVFRALQS